MSTLKLDTIASRDGTESTDVTNVINGSAKAWVNFDGTTASIRESFNVGSITDIAAGRFNVNFTNAFEDTNYVCVTGLNLNTSSGGSNNYNRSAVANAGTTSIAYINTYADSSAVLIDVNVTQLAVFR